jgi:hypothetical protein
MTKPAHCNVVIAIYSGDIERLKNENYSLNGNHLFLTEFTEDSEVPKSADTVVFAYSNNTLSSSALHNLFVYIYDHVLTKQRAIYLLDRDIEMEKGLFRELQDIKILSGFEIKEFLAMGN